jgi:hypothetical protein
VDGRRVERIVTVHDAQETSRLLKRPIANARHLQQLAAIAERTVRIPKRHDIPGERFGQSRDAR